MNEQQRYRNPFNPDVVSDERWRAYVERYLAERRRGGADDESELDVNFTEDQT